MLRQLLLLGTLAASSAAEPAAQLPEDLLSVDNGTVKIAIDRAKGASITHFSWSAYPQNAVNSYDPGRLIQQSYYSGKRIDRRTAGQHQAWSPWSWNPIQGGGVGSWSEVPVFKRIDRETLYSETIPKLWDMPDEPAAALMRQWTSFEPGMPNVVVVRCQLKSERQPGDRWGPPNNRHQEVPATYFTRNFTTVKSYLGDGRWRTEPTKPGPPWSQAKSPRHAMACFEESGQGIAVFSPNALFWNYGPVGKSKPDTPLSPPCIHIAPVTLARLAPRSTYTYRYWMAVGTAPQIAARLETLWKNYADDRAQLTLQK